jgi:hypothetical protein
VWVGARSRKARRARRAHHSFPPILSFPPPTPQASTPSCSSSPGERSVPRRLGVREACVRVRAENCTCGRGRELEAGEEASVLLGREKREFFISAVDPRGLFFFFIQGARLYSPPPGPLHDMSGNVTVRADVPIPVCCICLDAVGARGGPATLPCGHSACVDCLRRLSEAAARRARYDPDNRTAGESQCPTCRSAFAASQTRVNFAPRDMMTRAGAYGTAADAGAYGTPADADAGDAGSRPATRRRYRDAGPTAIPTAGAGPRAPASRRRPHGSPTTAAPRPRPPPSTAAAVTFVAFYVGVLMSVLQLTRPRR